MPKVTQHRQGSQTLCFLTHSLHKPDLQNLIPPGQPLLVRSSYLAKSEPRVAGGCFPETLPCGPGPCSKTQGTGGESTEAQPARGRLLQRAVGAGRRPQHSRRHRKGPAPSCQFYQPPRAAVPAPRGSCNSQKQKPQRRNFPSGPGRPLGPHPLHRATWADSQAAGRHNGSWPCCHPGACGLPCSSGWEAKPPGIQLG